MNPTYRIRDWNKHFENNRTRELKELRFVILSNKQDGDGYTELLDHPNGAAHYGAWVAITQVASKGQHPAGGCGISAGCCECRGVLLRDGARPHDLVSLSRLTRIPAVVLEEAIPRLVDIGWIDSSQAEPPQVQPDSEQPQGGAAARPSRSRRGVRKSAASIEQNGMEQNGKEDARARAALVRELFDFWKSEMDHPQAQLTPERKKKIEERLGDSTPDEIRAAVRGCKASDFHMGREPGKPEVHDDIELICRHRGKLERFIAKASDNGSAELSPEARAARDIELARRAGYAV